MTSFERAAAMQAFLEQALAPHRFVPQAILPADPAAPVHVATLVSGEGDAIHVVFAVSQFNAFMPVAVTDFAPDQVSSVMLAAIAQLQQPCDWEVGTVMEVVGAHALAAQDVTGLVLLLPETAGMLAVLPEEATVAGERFAPRLAVFLKGDETREARHDLWNMLDRFDASNRDVFLLYREPASTAPGAGA